MDQYTILKTFYGYDTFRVGQKEIIEQILKKQDVLGIMPTGAGKSICYQVPAMLLQGMTLVISPLISLMQDQVQGLLQIGIPAAYLNSSLRSDQYREVYEGIKQKKYKLLYLAPERLLQEDFVALMQRVNIAMITVDEAHCISHWGQDFRPSYRKIIEFMEKLPYRPIISAFTATATKQVKEDIIEQLQLQDPYTITTGFDRKNLYFEVRHPKNKDKTLYQLLKQYRNKSGIVYCSTRKQVDAVTQMLKQQGFLAEAYHAGHSEEHRQTVQHAFLYDDISIIVATNAFGMGIDKSNVSFVIHYNMPADMESYYQEAGRAGRDGSPADCILLYSGKDVQIHKFLIENGKQQEDEYIHQQQWKQIQLHRLKQMTFYCHSTSCLRHQMLQYFGEQSEPTCENCSICKGNVEEVDITIPAQKILSCIYRLQGRFGSGMVMDVLLGSEKQRLFHFQLEQLSTYGIMKENSRSEIKEMIDYLLFHDYIKSENEQFPVLLLGPRAKEILVDKKTIFMKKVKTAHSIKQKSVQEELFGQLKALRNQIAKAQHLPSYLIFHDTSLQEMCQIRPTTMEAFLRIAGVGEVKAKRYGKAFMEVIETYERNESGRNS